MDLQKTKNRFIRLYYNYKFRADMIDFNKSQWWSLDQLEDFQNKRLRKMIDYAYHHIPAYRKKFNDAGITPNDIKTKADLPKIPTTTRAEIQENKQNFTNPIMIKTTLYTGGSTGTPLQFHESKEKTKIRQMAHYRGWSWNGYKPNIDRLINITSTQGIIRKKNAIQVEGNLSNDDIIKIIEQIHQFKPKFIRGYVSSLFIIAKYCLDHNIKLTGITALNPISENLYDYQRPIIEKGFQSKIFEEYCCNDGGACAWECEAHSDGLHYCMERAIIEENNGDMIITDLWNTALPFIRYINGDSVTFLNKPCPCGRQLPLIKVKGRTNDILISKKGAISPTHLYQHYHYGDIFKDNENFRIGIREIQFVQKKGFIIEINVAANKQWLPTMNDSFHLAMQELFKDMNKISINYVDAVKTTSKGKRHTVINEDIELLKALNN